MKRDISQKDGMPLRRMMQSALNWMGKALFEALLTPLEEIKRAQSEQSEEIRTISARIETLHRMDPVAKECDLAMLDDRICFLVRKCRQKGHTTAEDRRIVSRMHEAYRARGGNHGEEKEFEIFCALPTEEEFDRKAKGEII